MSVHSPLRLGDRMVDGFTMGRVKHTGKGEATPFSPPYTARRCICKARRNLSAAIIRPFDRVIQSINLAIWG